MFSVKSKRKLQLKGIRMSVVRRSKQEQNNMHAALNVI